MRVFMEISLLSRYVLRELCTNSRVTITELSEKYKVSRHVIKERINALEKEFGLRYTIEPNYNELGYNTIHVLRSSFKKKPSNQEIKEILHNSRVAQFVATAEGYFELIVFAIAKNPAEYSQWENAFNAKFAKYGMYTKQSEVDFMSLGFVPIGSDAIEASAAEPIYKKMLSILNEDSRISIRDLSKKMGSSEALTRYYFRELNKTKLIKKYTTLATKPYFKSNILYFCNYTIKSGIESRYDKERKTMYWKSLDEFPILSEYPINWSIIGADRSFTWANYNDYRQGLKQSVDIHKQAFGDALQQIRVGVIKEIIKGYAPIRNIDQKQNFVLVERAMELV